MAVTLQVTVLVLFLPLSILSAFVHVQLALLGHSHFTHPHASRAFVAEACVNLCKT